MEQQGTFFSTKELEKMFVVAFDDWLDYGVRLKRTEGKGDWFKSQHSWAIGDWLLAGKKEWGIAKTRPEAERIWKKPWSTLKNIMGTAKDFPKSRRRDFLYFNHHYVLRKYSEAVQEEWLNRCIKERWTINSLKKAMSGEKFVPRAKREAAERLADWEATRKGEFPLLITPINITIPPDSSAILQYLFQTEKETHGQKKVEDLISWLATKGMQQLGWESRVKEFMVRRKAQGKAHREESARSHTAWKAKMDAQKKFSDGLPKGLNHSEYISRLRDWEAAWEKSRSGSSNQT